MTTAANIAPDLIDDMPVYIGAAFATPVDQMNALGNGLAIRTVAFGTAGLAYEVGFIEHAGNRRYVTCATVSARTRFDAVAVEVSWPSFGAVDRHEAVTFAKAVTFAADLAFYARSVYEAVLAADGEVQS